MTWSYLGGHCVKAKTVEDRVLSLVERRKGRLQFSPWHHQGRLAAFCWIEMTIHLLMLPLHRSGPACVVAVHEGLCQKLWQSPVEWHIPVSLWLCWRRLPEWWLGVESRRSVSCGNHAGCHSGRRTCQSAAWHCYALCAPVVCTLWTSRTLVCSWMLGGGLFFWKEGLRMPPSSPEVFLLGRGIVGTGLLV